MSELSYSLHLGSDKNRKPSSRNMAKSNASGTTSLSNNAIQNARGLSRVDKHNYRKYDNNTELIEIIRGTSSLYDDVKKLYEEEFKEAVDEYNSRQTRDDRKITDYFKKISDNSKNDLACEIIIELGDKKYWDTKDDKFKHKMTNVFKEQVSDLEQQLPNFKIASAIIHYDETSPHLHIVGVPIKYKNKNGMKKQVGKGDV
ncbi:MAG TPA: plasmid recombination protein, partial [Candidatus Pelethosoma merdigallinarum]|nr:plasmid recombination protein [Candidatus Pelethosoma merdigallinarum]